MVQFRRPEYTGENRCLPCTVLNVVIATFAAAVLFGLLWTIGSMQVAAMIASGVFGLAMLVIWAWGYLIPGTPTFTRRYLPPRVLGWFGKSVPEPDDRDDIEALLIEAQVIEPCADQDDLCLTDEIARTLDEKLATLDAGRDLDRFIEAVGIAELEVDVEQRHEARILKVNGRHGVTWPSKTALLVDIALATVLQESVQEWEQLPPELRVRAIVGARVFLEECPDGGGPVELRAETVSSCCSEREVYEAVCTESGERLFEQTRYGV